MKDKNISLIELENKGSDEVNAVHINKNENSKYASLKKEIDFNFDYEVNFVKFENLNENKLQFIRNQNDMETISKYFLFTPHKKMSILMNLLTV